MKLGRNSAKSGKRLTTKDFLEKELDIGDEVAYVDPTTHSLRRGTITGLAQAGIVITPKANYRNPPVAVVDSKKVIKVLDSDNEVS